MIVILGSFFKFFDSPVIPEKFEDIDEKTCDLLVDDCKLGKAFIKDIVPNAVLHLTDDIYDDYSSEPSSSGSFSSPASTNSLSPTCSSSESDRSLVKTRKNEKNEKLDCI